MYTVQSAILEAVRVGNDNVLSFRRFIIEDAILEFWIDPGSILDRSWIDPGSILDRSWIDPGSILDRSWLAGCWQRNVP